MNAVNSEYAVILTVISTNIHLHIYICILLERQKCNVRTHGRLSDNE